MSEQEGEAFERKSFSGFDDWLPSDGPGDESNRPGSENLTITFVDLAMLSILDSFPMTGYVLRRTLLAQFGLKTSYGSLYPRLKVLEKSGVIKYSDNVGQLAARKSGINYELTSYGRKIFDSNLRLFQDYFRKIQSNVRTKFLRHPDEN
jgi:DNA-binding PadR family transcriptional regulator